MNDLSNILITKEESKRERKHNAVKLPNNIEQCNIPIYVNYYKECYDQKNKCYREYFKIEKHPHNIHNKLYVSSKSNKINILEKLEEIKKMLLIIEEEYELYNKNNETKQLVNSNEEVIKSDGEVIKSELQVAKCELPVSNILQNKKNSIILPKYISIRRHETQPNNYYLIYDKKSGSKRNTLKALCSNSTLLNTNLELFIKKLEEKFVT
jgi:S-adenosylmethionine:tRNA-ribosyltransferase-isomerase (queuine synthetase)